MYYIYLSMKQTRYAVITKPIFQSLYLCALMAHTFDYLIYSLELMRSTASGYTDLGIRTSRICDHRTLHLLIK